MKPLRLGTRMSVLALAQAGQVAAEIERVTGHPVERVGIETEGDRLVDVPLATGPLAKGWFTGAIEAALREGRIDLAVHSLKDLPVADASGLVIIVPERADPADVLLLGLAGAQRRFTAGADPTAAGASRPTVGIGRVGASSPRRMALLRAWFPDCEGAFLRGNVTTRIQRLRNGDFDAILLAGAGLDRLVLGSAWAGAQGAPLSGVQRYRLNPALWPGAPGQGALALQCRADDLATRGTLEALSHPPTHRAVDLERAALAALGTGCALPFGAWVSGDVGHFALAVDDQLTLGRCAAIDLPRVVATPDARKIHAVPLSGPLLEELP